MKRILVMLLCCSVFSAKATVLVSGSISSNTTWTKANSPYIVNGNLSVDSGVRLTIQPGVVVQVDSGYTFTINGSLTAEGTTTDSILFTSSKTSPTRNAWQGIAFTLKTIRDTSTIFYCRFEYASTAITTTITYWLRVYYSTFRFNNTAFRILGQTYHHTEIYRTLITRNDTGVYVSGPPSWGDDNLNQNTITYNAIGMRQQNTGGIGFTGNNFNYNIIGYSSDGAGHGTQGNTFIGNILYGVRVIGKGTSKDVGYISNGLYMNNPTAIYIDSADYGQIYGNTIAYNDIGIEDNKTFRPNAANSTMNLSYNCYHHNSIFSYRQNSALNRNSQNDYWGTTSTASIDSTIFDYNDNSTLGKINYTYGTGINTTGSVCKPTTAPPPCYPHPDSLIANITSSTTATISWPSVSGAYAYEYYIVPLSATAPSSGTITFDTFFNASNLVQGEKYQICVRTRCQTSPFYSAWICDTLTLPCNAPTNFIIYNVHMFNATASWDTVAGATGYEYYVAVHPSTPTLGTVTTNHSIYITGLNPNTTYDFCVRTRCISTVSAWICDTFHTPTTGINTITKDDDVQIYPNPSKGIFTIALGNTDHAAIMVYDVMGKEVYQSQISNSKTQITLAQPAGIYTIRILTDDAVINKRIVIE